MEKKKKTMSRITSFLLIVSLTLGCFGLSGLENNEVYAAVDGTATVRIIDANNNEVIANASISIESGVTTLGAVVAAACQTEERAFELNSSGFPSTIGGVTLDSGYMWMSMLNDSGAPFDMMNNFNNITTKDGDRIVLYAYDGESDLAYSFFTVVTNAGVNVMQYEGNSYITGSFVLKLETNVWGTVKPSAGTELVITDENGVALSTQKYDYGLPPNNVNIAKTSNSGTISIELYGNIDTLKEDSFSKTYIVSSITSGIVKPYCKIVMTETDMNFSQPIDSTGYRLSDPIVPHTLDINDSVQSVIDGIRDINDIHEDTYYDNDWALGMVAAGLTPTQAEKDRYLTWVLDLVKNEGTPVARKAKTAIALTALNIDARQVPNKDTGETINLIDQVAYASPTGIDPTWSAPFMLSLYDLGNYLIPEDAFVTRELLIDTIIEGKGVDFWGTYGTDGTGTVLNALAPYYNSSSEVNGISVASCEAITTIIDDATVFLSSEMGEYGGFPGSGGSLNANTQAVVVTGLNSLGINPHTSTSFYNAASAMDNLLSYKTTDHKLGFIDNTISNDSASKQGMWAFATFQNLSNSRSSNLYNFTKEIATYTNWPDADLLTSIKVTPPTLTEYTYNQSETNYTPNTNGIVVTGTYNGDASNTTNIAIDLCTVSKIDLSEPGTQTVTVSYQGLKATFMVAVKSSDGTLPQLNTVSIRVSRNSSVIASSNTLVIENGKTSALDVLKTVLDNANVNYLIESGGYVSEIAGVGQFDEGGNSGWLYSVNGDTPPTTAARDYKLQNGDRVVWYYTKDFTKDASSSAWVPENQAGAVQDGLVSVTTDVKAVTGSDGTAKVTVSTTQLDTAVTDALKAAAASKDDAKPAITIAIEADSKAQGVETVIPKAAFANLVNKGIQQMTIASPLGNMTLDLETLKDIVKGGTGDVSLSIKKAEESQGRPVIRLEINNGGKAIGTFSKPITITVPYTPAAGETEQGIAVFHLDDKGQWKNIKASKYDSKNKAIVFRTDHFSDFVIAYSHKTFGDIKGHWAQTPIEYLASRRIIQGMTEESFAPNGTITRAQFVTLLAGMAGADMSQYSLSQFNDVKDNAWYKGAVAWAAENGIVRGQQAADGSFWFNPNQNISRQDMAVVMMRYLAWAKEPVAETTKAIAFKDGSSIASYAKESVTSMQKAGLINGRTTSDNQTIFDPAGKLTRAEAAQILTNQLYKQF